MNVAVRKLAMLEKSILKKEEIAKIEGYVSSPVDPVFKEKVIQLMDRVRVL